MYRARALVFSLLAPALAAAQLPRDPDRIVVAQDGSGDVRSIQEAVDKTQWHRPRPVEILIRPGVYREVVRVPRERPNLHFIGADRNRTVVEAEKNEAQHPEAGWPARSVFAVEADDTVIANLTIRNTTPKGGSQAEALYVNGQRVVVRNCALYSHQDTVNLSGRVYLEHCYIEGDVDFAWGYGVVMFNRCELRAVGDGYYLQSRNAIDRTGMILVDCVLSAAPGVARSWLARVEVNRFPGSHVALISCRLGPHIPPKGWLLLGQGTREHLRFQEFDSRDAEGRPLDLSQRLPAAHVLDAEQAAVWRDPRAVLGGTEGWHPVDADGWLSAGRGSCR